MMPYQKNLLSAIGDASAFGLGKFFLIGDKKRIVETCYVNSIDFRRLEILNFPLDMEAVEYAKRMVEEKRFDFYVFGDVPEVYQLNVFGMRNPLAIGSIDIIELPGMRSPVFISNRNRHLYVDFEEKMEAIMQARLLLKTLGAKRINVVMLTNGYSKNEVLDGNIAKMLLQEKKLSDVEILGIQDLSGFFTITTKFNIFTSGANLLIFKNYEISRVFLSTLSAFTSAKIATFSVFNKHLAVDAKLLNSQENILFTLLTLERLHFQKNATAVRT